MLIHAIDQGRRSGRALGLAGEVPKSGFVVLRGEKQDRSVGHGNLIAFLDDSWRARRPDIVASEDPLSVAAWYQMNKSRGFPTDPSGVESGFELHGIISGMAARYGIRHEVVRRQSVLAYMTGAKSHGGREGSKAAMISACIRMGLVEATCTDDDRCDAVGIFVYVSAVTLRRPVGKFQLFA